MQAILCIDDDPIRYLALTRFFLDHYRTIPVLISCRIPEVKFYLENYKVAGVCLDHDMPINGTFFATQFLIERNIPVVVASHNPGGAMNIMDILAEWEVPHMYRPAKDTDTWLKDVVSFFGFEFSGSKNYVG